MAGPAAAEAKHPAIAAALRSGESKPGRTKSNPSSCPSPGPGSATDWQALGDPATLRAEGQVDQLAQWVAMIEGRPHSLPGYAEALAVQQTIEALLAGA